MSQKWLKSIDRIGKIKSFRSKSGLSFSIRLNPEALQSISAVDTIIWLWIFDFPTLKAKIDHNSLNFGLIVKNKTTFTVITFNFDYCGYVFLAFGGHLVGVN